MFVSVLEASVLDDSKTKECFKNKKISLITNTNSITLSNESSMLKYPMHFRDFIFGSYSIFNSLKVGVRAPPLGMPLTFIEFKNAQCLKDVLHFVPILEAIYYMLTN